MVQAWMGRQREGKSREVPERIMGEILAMFQNRDQGLFWSYFLHEWKDYDRAPDRNME